MNSLKAHKIFYLVLLCISCSDGQSTLDGERFTRLTDLVYADDEQGKLLADLYIPDNPVTNPVPAVVMIRGGGFVYTDKEELSHLAAGLADRGLAAVSIEYRPASMAEFPGLTEDTKAAVRWLRANSTSYGINTEAIALMGASAGAYLAVYHGVTNGHEEFEGSRGNTEVSSAVQAIIALAPESGPSELAAWTTYLGEQNGIDEDLREIASALTHIEQDSEPPILLIHSKADSVVPFEESLRIKQSYIETNNTVKLIDLEEARHSFWNDEVYFSHTVDYTTSFLSQAFEFNP